MPQPETSDRGQFAVLWPISGYGADGQPTVSSDYEQIRCRWERKRGRQPDPQGNLVTVDATVVVDQTIAIGSVMWQGKYEDFLGTGSGGEDSELMEVVTYNETPDLKNRFKTRTVGLRRYKDQLPTQT